MIYCPFIRLLDKQDEENYNSEYDSFVSFFRKNETSLADIRLTEQDTANGEFAKALCAELEHNLYDGIVLAYQPQYNYDGNCIGVEALLRWHHPVYGILYPPIIVKLAKEGGFLAELEEAVFMRAIDERPLLLEKFGENIKLSITHLARNLHINVIAEYVETKEQRDALHEIGCDYYQGHLYSSAVFLSDDIEKKENR